MVAKLRPNFFPFTKMVSKLKRESINQANKLYWRYHFIKNTLPVNRSLLVVSRVISQSKATSARFTGTWYAPFPLAAFFSSLAYSGCYQSRVILTFASADGFSRVLFGISWYCTLWTFLWQQFLLIKNFYKSKTFTLDIIAQNVGPWLFIQNQRSSKFECEWSMKSSIHNKRRKLIKKRRWNLLSCFPKAKHPRALFEKECCTYNLILERRLNQSQDFPFELEKRFFSLSTELIKWIGHRSGIDKHSFWRKAYTQNACNFLIPQRSPIYFINLVDETKFWHFTPPWTPAPQIISLEANPFLPLPFTWLNLGVLAKAQL